MLNSSVDRPHTDVMSSQRTESSLQRGLMLFERQKVWTIAEIGFYVFVLMKCCVLGWV